MNQITKYVHRVTAAFTLIELIGVLAIMAIMASAIAPNALKSLDRAAVRAETDTLHHFAEQTKYFLTVKGWLPGNNGQTWYQDLSVFVDAPPSDIQINKRQMNRIFVLEPNGTGPSQRAMFISTMRTTVALGPATSATDFANVWNWNTNNLTASPAPAGWTAWNNTNIEYLVIERVSLQNTYSQVTLRNNGASVTVRCTVAPPVGTSYNITLAPANETTLPLYPKTRLSLYKVTTDTIPNYVYIVSSGVKVIDFNDTRFWQPQ